MEYVVRLHRSVRKKLESLPEGIQDRFDLLLDVLKQDGPTGPHAWANYGKLGGSGNKYHCHLSGSHAWVACWKYDKEILTIEVYYAGSHQKAPY